MERKKKREKNNNPFLHYKNMYRIKVKSRKPKQETGNSTGFLVND